MKLKMKTTVTITIVVVAALFIILPIATSAFARESADVRFSKGFVDGCSFGVMKPGQHTQAYINGFNAGLQKRGDCRAFSSGGSTATATTSTSTARATASANSISGNNPQCRILCSTIR